MLSSYGRKCLILTLEKHTQPCVYLLFLLVYGGKLIYPNIDIPNVGCVFPAAKVRSFSAGNYVVSRAQTSGIFVLDNFTEAN